MVAARAANVRRLSLMLHAMTAVMHLLKMVALLPGTLCLRWRPPSLCEVPPFQALRSGADWTNSSCTVTAAPSSQCRYGHTSGVTWQLLRVKPRQICGFLAANRLRCDPLALLQQEPGACALEAVLGPLDSLQALAQGACCLPMLRAVCKRLCVARA